MTTTSWLPQLDPQSSQPLYEQILEAVAIAVTAEELRPGDPLPSVRSMATSLRLNPNTTARALRELERLGLTRSVRGIGTVVAEDAAQAARALAHDALGRELARTVGVARRLGLDLDTLQDALERSYKEAIHAPHRHG